MKETPIVVSIVSILFTISMFLIALPFKILAIQKGQFKFFATKNDLSAHLYGDVRQTSHNAVN